MADQNIIENAQQAPRKPPAPLDLKGREPRIFDLGRFLWKLSAYLTIFLITALAVFSTQVLVSGQSASSWFSRLPLVSGLRSLAESANQSLKGEERDRINILLLGMGGKNHDGSYLTDTIMLMSLEPSTKKAALISIPRDLVVPMEDLGYRKINNVNAFAERAEPGSGGMAASQALARILDMPIDYYVRVDFQGFVNFVDRLGGITVEVDNTLNDYSYPVLGREDAYPYESRYEHLRVEKGTVEMDGSLALKFARSRHGINGEGSDFARARRQQKIIAAVKEKALSTPLVHKPKLIYETLEDLKDNYSSNLKVWEMLELWNMFKDLDTSTIITRVLDNGPEGLLVDDISPEGAYILLPRSGDFKEVQYLVFNIFSDAPKNDVNLIKSERPTIEVRNGTWINGLASKIAVDLEKYGFTVVRIGNSGKQNFEKSVIYDLSYGEKSASLQILKEKTGANTASGLPQWLVDDIEKELGAEKKPTKPDFILVLGRDADQTRSGEVNPEQ